MEISFTSPVPPFGEIDHAEAGAASVRDGCYPPVGLYHLQNGAQIRLA